MSLFRSEIMSYCNLVLPRENAWEILNELGELSALHFVDQDPNSAFFSRPFSNFIRRCDDLRLKIDYIEFQMKTFSKTIKKCENYPFFLKNMRNFLSKRERAEKGYFEEIENDIFEKAEQLASHLDNYEHINKQKNSLFEYTAVLKNTSKFFENSQYIEIQQNEFKLNFITGIINKEDELRFKRMIFRISKGNCYTTIEDMEQIENNAESSNQKNVNIVKKQVFSILFSGGSLEALKKKIIKVCDSFGATIYEIPIDKSSITLKLQEIEAKLYEMKNMVSLTKDQITNSLDYFSLPRNTEMEYSFIEELKLYITKEKAIYQTLNLFNLDNNLYIGYCWCSRSNTDDVKSKLKRITSNKQFVTSHFEEIKLSKENTPPTYFKLNDFTAPFQSIVDTYGIPRYREINPGLFTVVTFPFLFAIMFGDLGHGTLLFAFALYLTLFNEKIAKNGGILKDCLPFRYLLLMMGFFAAYCGLIYNDMMSIPLNFFGSCYNITDNKVQKESNCTYSMGVDPVWFVSSNELSQMNSLKMKLSVIFGVIQMTIGVLLKGVNNINFRQPIDFFFEFIPQILFMVCTFGWMDAMIFIKWLTPWTHTYQAPSIINLFMNMVLGLGSTNGSPLLDDIHFQETLQFIFLIISALCIPWMLVPKPLLLIHFNKKKTIHVPEKNFETRQPLMGTGEIELVRPEKLESVLVLDNKHDHNDSSEIFVHQLIETIEFVLGSISNTASYLRLWALSLAHSQLSKVFFEKGVKGGIESGNALVIIVGVFVFLHITFAVLMCMDLMECFLHALRLHWVEFQNKFFKADGYLFEPFCFVSSFKKLKSD